jgi:hypothetical protein
MTFELKTKAQGKMLAAYEKDRSRISVIIGPLGSGKTIETCVKIFDLMCEQPPDKNKVRNTRWMAVRNTYGDLMNTTIKDWLGLFEELGEFTKGGKEPPTHHLHFKLEDKTTVKAELIFLAMDRDDSIKKLRGTQLTGLWLNEMKELNKAVLDMADGRHGRFPQNVGWHGILGDSNSPDEDHWLYKLAEEEKPEGWAFFRQPGGLKRDGVKENGRVNWVFNPEAENVVNLPDGSGYYTRMQGGKKDDWIAVNLANEYGFVSTGKAIFEHDYYDDVHCKTFEFMEGEPIIRGWDFGHDPSVVFMQLTPKGRVLVRHEVIGSNMGAARFCDDLLIPFSGKNYNGWEFEDVGDPAGASGSEHDETKSCFSELWDREIDVQGGVQNIGRRLESVRWFLGRMIEGRPAFIIHPDCKVLRKALKGGYQYRRMQMQGERYTDKPDKNEFSHIADALQYGCGYLRGFFGEDYEEHEPEPEGISATGGY